MSGSILLKMDPNMTEEQLQQRRATERSKERGRERLRQEIEEVGGEVNYDAKKFTDALRNTTQFLLCAVCAYEGPKSEMIDREKLGVALDCSGIYEKYNEWIDTLEHGSKYDQAYCNAVIEEMENGLLKDVTTICNKCADHLTGASNQKEDGLDHSSHVPPHALVNGLFQGAIPNELQGLTKVELSMISIYTNCTRIVLNTGHYHAKPTLYTIITNDFVELCEILPRIPNHHQFAILRHHKAEYMAEFRYRPGKVQAALDWLRQNNHLYSDDKIGINENAFDGKGEEEHFEQECFQVDDEEITSIGRPEKSLSNDAGSITSTNTGDRGPVHDRLHSTNSFMHRFSRERQ